MVVLPEGYHPQTLKQLLVAFPTVGVGLFIHVGNELLVSKVSDPSGAMVKMPTEQLIKALEDRGLVQFAIAPNEEPGMFTAPREAFSPDEWGFVEKLLAFWDVQGDFDSRTGKVEGVQAAGQVPLKPSLPYTVLQPLHWETALHRKMEAINAIKFIERLPPTHRFPEHVHIDWSDLNEELQALRAAQVYSFSGETMQAIMTAAQSIPHDAKLESIEVPRERAGWFWFQVPMPVASSPIASGTTAALLWSWDTAGNGTPMLRFSAYVMDAQGGDVVPSFKVNGRNVVPSTKWMWPVGYSFHDMIGMNTVMYDRTYAPGTKLANQPHLIGREATLKVVAELSLFFMMACLWFRQTVPGTKKKMDPQLTQSDENIGRHVRKKYQKELKTEKPPTVRVVALRKTAAEPREHVEGEGTPERTVHVRFVVSGHARLQACGPEHKERKLIWVSPFIKGRPEDPFKESGPKVYAVVR